MEKSVKARVIVIGNAKGGSGKSTTAMHLAVALMGLGHAVATIGGHLHRNRPGVDVLHLPPQVLERLAEA